MDKKINSMEINDDILDAVNGGTEVIEGFEKNAYGEYKPLKKKSDDSKVSLASAIPVAGVEKLSGEGMSKKNNYT
ncbi:MAG: hypothetical protein K5894_00820 [Lachnospiraceae bacterium]|nr:hypothetical protein [Lachnospiraceae bacterium]